MVSYEDSETKIGILGGGLSGLVLAYYLKRDFDVLEKRERCGGLCRSITEQGFTFDVGGHIFYSKSEDTLSTIRTLLRDNLVKSKCRDMILFKGRYIKYPFEQNLSSLPKEDNFECLYHFICNDSNPPKDNLKEWIYYTFGKGIAEKYLIPYNEKIWKIKSELMSSDWVEGRIPRPELKDIIKSSIGIKAGLKFARSDFYYPKHGGIEALIRAFINRIPSWNIYTSFDVKEIKKKGKAWIVSDGENERVYRVLVSTIPIIDLVKALDSAPERILNATNELRYNSLIVVMIGLKTQMLTDMTALYFPQADVPFHRVCFPKNFSTFCAPPGQSSLIAEITSTRIDAIWKTNDLKIADYVIDCLSRENLIEEEMVSYKKVVREKYAYIVYDLNYKKNIKVIKDYISKLGIHLCGRFAEFEYLNMDACLQRAKNLAFFLARRK